MAELKLTKRRLDLLRAVANGDVYSEWGNEYDRSARHRKVTARMTELAHADWVRIGTPHALGHRSRLPWELTEAGRKVLEEAES